VPADPPVNRSTSTDELHQCDLNGVEALTMGLPFGARPSNSSDIVLELGAVAKIAFVRPSFGNASLGSPLHDVLSRSEFLCERCIAAWPACSAFGTALVVRLDRLRQRRHSLADHRYATTSALRELDRFSLAPTLISSRHTCVTARRDTLRQVPSSEMEARP
jgi:hypothetical protein